jgi:large subunit ribosomal protein L23
MYDPRDIIIRPVISEKSYDLIEQNRYTFEVAKTASKPQIAQAITEIFDVTVTNVNTMNVTGKPRRLRFAKGKTRDWKKAIVTLRDGDKIDLFPSV